MLVPNMASAILEHKRSSFHPELVSALNILGPDLFARAGPCIAGVWGPSEPLVLGGPELVSGTAPLQVGRPPSAP